MAFSGMVMEGKEYMAPCTGLQRMPFTVLRTCSVSLAFSPKTCKVAVRSCVWRKKRDQQNFNCLITVLRKDNEKKKKYIYIHALNLYRVFYF